MKLSVATILKTYEALIFDPQKLELYNIKEDIHEDNNLAEQYPEKVKELEQLMNNARTESDMFNFGR